MGEWEELERRFRKQVRELEKKRVRSTPPENILEPLQNMVKNISAAGARHPIDPLLSALERGESVLVHRSRTGSLRLKDYNRLKVVAQVMEGKMIVGNSSTHHYITLHRREEELKPSVIMSYVVHRALFFDARRGLYWIINHGLLQDPDTELGLEASERLKDALERLASLTQLRTIYVAEKQFIRTKKRMTTAGMNARVVEEPKKVVQAYVVIHHEEKPPEREIPENVITSLLNVVRALSRGEREEISEAIRELEEELSTLKR